MNKYWKAMKCSNFYNFCDIWYEIYMAQWLWNYLIALFLPASNKLSTNFLLWRCKAYSKVWLKVWHLIEGSAYLMLTWCIVSNLKTIKNNEDKKMCLLCKIIRYLINTLWISLEKGKWFDFNHSLGCVYPTLYVIRLLGQVYYFILLICYPCSS